MGILNHNTKAFILTLFFGFCLFSFLSACGIYKYSDARKVPPGSKEKVKRNLEEGRGVSIEGLVDARKHGGGTSFLFASSNPMWRATLEILDFLPLSNVDYSGGIITTDWYNEGTAGKINENDVDINAIKNSEMIFLEGYLWDEGEPKKAFDKAIKNSNKAAMSLSDLFCVERHKPHFLNLVKNNLNITFANEQEILSLIGVKSFDEVISFGKQLGKLLVITRGEKGSIAIQNNEAVECESKKDLKIVDLTGAGDLFAAGFLHGYINNLSIKESLEKGTEMSSKIIQKIGARLN